mgnify:CR=1 FL=1|tara:strand:- start:328 stop:537 length:210 start_codon:yes stop_codon:yes gene_type:complete
MNEDGVLLNVETNTYYTQINFKENEMEVWKPDDEQDLHDIPERDMTVWKYFVYTIGFGVAIFLVLELFA